MPPTTTDLFTPPGEVYTLDSPGGTTLREYIVRLVELERRLGSDILVQKWLPSRGRHHAPLPIVAFKAMLPDAKVNHRVPQPRQFWHETDPMSTRGEAVIRV